jgi:dTDP-6-deoxy-L-talose 4-dehydrogenase (NAD+)
MSAGEQIRDYMNDWDVAYNLMMLAGTNSGIVNICSGHPVKIKDVVAAWIEAHSWWVDMKLGVFPYNDYEPMEFWGDPSKLRSILNPMIYAKERSK